MEDAIAGAVAAQLESSAVNGQQIEASYGASLTSDVAAFSQSMQQAENTAVAQEPSPIAQAMFSQFDHLNGEAEGLMEYAKQALASENELTPSEIVMLTARSQEFMFHAQLTANVANRAADGMQQLFRQQS